MKNMLKSFALVSSVLVISIALCYVVTAWTEPGSPAPAGNVAAPINTGGGTQTKNGSLNISGNVGIGTASPSQKLDVAGAGIFNWGGSSNGIVYLGDTNHGIKSTSGGGVTIFSYGVPNGIYLQQSSGSVGIGTASPSQKLDVAGSTVVDYLRVDPQDGTNEGGELQLAGSSDYGTFQIDNYQGNARIHTLAAGKQFQVLGGTIYSNGTGNNYFAGNVGIGTNSPGAKLEVSGQIKITGGTPGDGKVLTSDAGGLARWADPAGGTKIPAQICPDGMSVVGIDSSGNLICKEFGSVPIGFIPKGGCTQKLPDGNKKFFVTSASYTASSINSISAANSDCQAAAASAGLTGNYKALISLNKSNPGSQLTNNAYWNGGRIGVTDLCNWYLIAKSPSDFFTVGSGAASATEKGSGNYLWNPVTYDERGQATNSATETFTGFKPDGTGGYTALESGSNPCQSWYTCGTCEPCECGYHGATIWHGININKTISWAYNTDSFGYWQAYYGEVAGYPICSAVTKSLYCAEQ